jgi:gliding motility-associated-like protein
LSAEGCGEFDFNPPTVFSPNGDGKNETWLIAEAANLPECVMNIYDGRGMKIFEQKGYPSQGWDGTYNGKKVPEGTYYYVFSCNGSKPKTGSVLIVR